ncbi:MAG: hypothetical protein KKD73_05470 [Proteobacteria bacterium]|nr:hypothetical protein [Pseudomonadota bacterium]MBU1639796.1 hypothetical protein [Pseudomonadota bacterium]
METNNSGDDTTQEYRSRRGTWLWFVLNVLLFPGPAYFTLLRAREFSLARSSLHVVITHFLLFLIVAAATLQIVVPSIGELWMLLPILSGPVVLFMNRSLKSDFYPFELKTVTKKHSFTLLILLLVFLVYNILPELDLIAINEARESIPETSFQDIPLWQDLIILLIGALVLFGGYIINASPSFSINRCIILYSCFLLLYLQLFILLEFVFRFLKLTGGFGTMLGGVLLTSVLAVDYYDASTFGQYTRRYFLLTCTKGISFVLLWLCFLGLPQKAASLYAARVYDKVKPLPAQISYQHFVFPDQERFKSGHEAHRLLRGLYSRALQGGEQDRLDELGKIVAREQGISLQSDTDVSCLHHTVSKEKRGSTSLRLDELPFFRPVKGGWDVMLTAIVLQNGLRVSDFDQSIASFKSSLPRASQGQLPALQTPVHSRYVSYATGMQVDFVPPDFELIETLLTNKLIPVLCLRLAGKKHWAALVHLDHSSGLAWLRLESSRKQEKAIQLQFDANESEARRPDILSSQYVPLSLDYLTKQVANMAKPVIVYSKEGLHTILPDLFTAANLDAISRELASRGRQQKAADIISASDSPSEAYSGYAGYVKAMAHIKHLLTPSGFKPEPFLEDSLQVTSIEAGKARLQRVTWILSQLNNLRDEDRMDIAYKLVTNDHVLADPELFIRLAANLPVSSDLVDCNSALVIGRSLYLLGRHQEALGYFTIAFFRHPFSSAYEMWYRIALLKLDKPVPPPYSPPNRQPDLYLYFQTIFDVKNNNGDAAKKRLEAALKNDSHNILANQLMHRYFKQSLDDDFFFQTSEGL